MRPKLVCNNDKSLALWEYDSGLYTKEFGELAYKQRRREAKEQHQQRSYDNGSCN